ncbi:MAG: hypothetical protein NTV23_09495 [Propionibacteriales bacterium]|nr:hypothetical protein [Propionibacteriales bacterium]
MKSLGLDLGELAKRFSEQAVGTKPHGYVLVEANPDSAQKWAELLGVPVRRCHFSDSDLEARAAAGISANDFAEAFLPPPGPTRSGNFGEMLAALYLAAKKHPTEVLDPLKWRFINDKLKPAPKSDVVQLELPEWPDPSPEDLVTCAEVKARATKGPKGKPTSVENALAGSIDDRDGRLDKTLNWLKDMAIRAGVEGITIEQLDRFISPTDFGAYRKDYKAIAVIEAKLVADETASIPEIHDGCTLIVVSFTGLKDAYTATYAEMIASAQVHIDAKGDANEEAS